MRVAGCACHLDSTEKTCRINVARLLMPGPISTQFQFFLFQEIFA